MDFLEKILRKEENGEKSARVPLSAKIKRTKKYRQRQLEEPRKIHSTKHFLLASTNPRIIRRGIFILVNRSFFTESISRFE